MTRIPVERGRPVPPDILLEDYTDDIELGMLKRGKEADVYLIERIGPTRSCLLAEKRYADIDERTFRNNAVYRAHSEREVLRRDGIVKKRAKGGAGVRRAMAKGTEFGRRTAYARWVAAEWQMLGLLWHAGVPVPFPVSCSDDRILMEYVGDRDRVAERLAGARPARAELRELYDQFRAALLGMAAAGVVHADLSPYNMLVWHGRLWVIDVPQAVPFLRNDAATDLLYRDVHNVCGWFTRRGLDVDPEALFAEALTTLFEVKMTDLFVARE